MVEVGKVAYLRTTQELVFVLAKKDAHEDAFFPVAFTVRRPVLSNGGMSHRVEIFFLEELTTKEELLSETRGRSEIEALFESEPPIKAN